MVARVDARVGALGLQITSVETGGRTDGGEDREGCSQRERPRCDGCSQK